MRGETVCHGNTAHRLGHLGSQLLVAAAVASGNGEEGHHRTIGIGLRHFRQTLDKDINTLVLEFVTTAVDDQQCVVGNLDLGERGGHL